DTGAASVRVSPISRQASPGCQTAISVGTDQSEETALYSASTLHSDIPSAHVAHWSHGLSALAPNGFYQCLHHPIRAQLVPVPLSLVPNARRAIRLLAPDRPEA